jgi:hypothetical protein
MIAEKIQAIPTTYNRINFRSRLEARWAVVFDLLNIRWQYEPEKTFTGFSNYIPDFVLTLEDGQQVLFEVKGSAPTMSEESKLANIASRFHAAFIASGPIAEPDIRQIWIDNRQVCSSPAAFQACPFCGLLSLESLGNGKLLPVDHLCKDSCLTAEVMNTSISHLRSGGYQSRFTSNIDSVTARLAFEFAHCVPFEDSNLYERIEWQRKILVQLRDNRAYTPNYLLAFSLALFMNGQGWGKLRPFDASECPGYLANF